MLLHAFHQPVLLTARHLASLVVIAETVHSSLLLAVSPLACMAMAIGPHKLGIPALHPVTLVLTAIPTLIRRDAPRAARLLAPVPPAVALGARRALLAASVHPLAVVLTAEVGCRRAVAHVAAPQASVPRAAPMRLAEAPRRGWITVSGHEGRAVQVLASVLEAEWVRTPSPGVSALWTAAEVLGAIGAIGQPCVDAVTLGAVILKRGLARGGERLQGKISIRGEEQKKATWQQGHGVAAED